MMQTAILIYLIVAGTAILAGVVVAVARLVASLRREMREEDERGRAGFPIEPLGDDQKDDAAPSQSRADESTTGRRSFRR
jgi:Sec-independent protein translocase protein TatA